MSGEIDTPWKQRSAAMSQANAFPTVKHVD